MNFCSYIRVCFHFFAFVSEHMWRKAVGMGHQQTCTNKFESHWVLHSHGLMPHMFSDESNKLGNIHIYKNEMNISLKNTNLFADQFIFKYLFFSLFGPTTEFFLHAYAHTHTNTHTHTHTHIYAIFDEKTIFLINFMVKRYT